MARRNLYTDSSSHAAAQLDTVLRQPELEEQAKADAKYKVSVDEALHGSRVKEYQSSRNVTRVLFISTDVDLLDPAKQSLDGYLRVADLFDEVHMLILRTGIRPRQPVLRPNNNVWVYTVSTEYWWELPSAAKDMLETQLKFADGFRADIIVARDPYESGLVALQAAKRYNRVAQLHVTQHTHGIHAEKAGFLKRLLAWYTIPRFASVRVSTKRIWDLIKRRVKTTDTAVLPRLNPYQAIADTPTTLNLKKMYPQYIFNMLYVGHLEEGSDVLEVMDAAHEMLHNTSVSLIIIGDGPLKSECKQKAKFLGIEKQIVILPSTVDIVQYLKTANVLFVPDTDPYSEDIVMQAVYAGIPMMLAKTDQRADLFTHAESAYFFMRHNVSEMSSGLTVMMNNVTLRQHMTEQARQTMEEFFHRDPELYQKQYRASVEAALFAGEEEK